MKAKTARNKVIVYDTTLRDGEQAPGCHLTAAQKLALARQISRLGADVIEAGFPASSPAELAGVKRIAETVGREKDAPEISAFARCLKNDIDAGWEAVRKARRPRINVFLATSDIHLKHKLKITRAEALRRAVEGVRYARSKLANVQFSAEDATRSNRAFLAKVSEAVIDAGAVTLNIPDTVGYAAPDETAELIRFLKKNVPNIARAVISTHCHDDLGLAVSNSLAALKNGARQVECTVNGIGERAGNCALEEIVMAVRTRKDHFGVWTGIRTREITDTSRMVSRMTGVPVPPNKAVVGANAFAHAAGIHQDGMLKHRNTYEIMKPEDVGLAGSKLVLTSRSGRTAVEDRLRKLGVRISGEAVLALMPRFKHLADGVRFVDDRALMSLVG